MMCVMKTMFVLVITMIPFYCSIAQTFDQQAIQLQFINHYGKVPPKSKSTIDGAVGSPFLYDEWRQMGIQIKDTLVRFDAVKLNLQSTVLEVLYQGEEKIISSKDFDQIIAEAKIFVPATKITKADAPLEGFFEVLGRGDEVVLVRHYIFIKAPNPQANIVGGPTTYRKLRMTENYIYNGETLTLIQKKKDLSTHYTEQRDKLNRYLKEHKIDSKDPMQLLKLVQHMTPEN